jgi:acetyl-CoA carboxylase biotin carboxyl carrier protein
MSESRPSSGSGPAVPAGVVRSLAELCHREGIEILEADDGVWAIRLQIDLTTPVIQPSVATTETNQQALAPFVQDSQWVGVFHRAAVVGMAPYVREGQPIKEGDVLGVIIAMQLQHEVTAARSGNLVRFLVEDGSAVEYGQPMLEID